MITAVVLHWTHVDCFFFNILCLLFSLLLITAVNICVLTMGGRLRWLWLSRALQIFLLSDLLFVESVYGK